MFTVTQLNVSADEPTRARLAELATRWSAVEKPLPISQVVRECVRRIHELETQKKERRR